ncbi:MAG: glycosyltransferase [Candidatus Aminicenantales bacterium]
MSKKISIIIPAYNEEKYLLNTLKSIETQEFNLSELEVIVVDNASTDNTAQVHRSFFQNNSIENLLVREPILGPARAKNTGAEKAQGEVLLFLDADSWMVPSTLEKVCDAYKKGCKMGTIYVKADSSDLVAIFFFNLINFGKNLFHIAANMGYCERNLFFEVGGFKSEIKHAEDYEFFTRTKKHLRKKGKSWCMINDAHIYTSTRRMERAPFKLGYLLTLLEWAFGGFLGLYRSSYRLYR